MFAVNIAGANVETRRKIILFRLPPRNGAGLKSGCVAMAGMGKIDKLQLEIIQV